MSAAPVSSVPRVSNVPVVRPHRVQRLELVMTECLVPAYVSATPGIGAPIVVRNAQVAQITPAAYMASVMMVLLEMGNVHVTQAFMVQTVKASARGASMLPVALTVHAMMVLPVAVYVLVKSGILAGIAALNVQGEPLSLVAVPGFATTVLPAVANAPATRVSMVQIAPSSAQAVQHLPAMGMEAAWMGLKGLAHANAARAFSGLIA